jgi:hypothetical protein
MRWDTKPDNRIRGTSAHPAPTRFEELLAGIWPTWRDQLVQDDLVPSAAEIVIQRVGTTWTKASRGGAGAAARNQCPSAFPLPVDAVLHSVDMAEENQFEPLHESADVVPASVREELRLRIRGEQLTMLPQVSAFWMPRRHRRPPRHPVSRGTWLRWTINYRLGPRPWLELRAGDVERRISGGAIGPGAFPE